MLWGFSRWRLFNFWGAGEGKVCFCSGLLCPRAMAEDFSQRCVRVLKRRFWGIKRRFGEL
jgi:hypothetical protein